jgi:hypothetical protein
LEVDVEMDMDMDTDMNMEMDIHVQKSRDWEGLCRYWTKKMLEKKSTNKIKMWSNWNTTLEK